MIHFNQTNNNAGDVINMAFTKPTAQDLTNRFSYHPPQGNQAATYEYVRSKVLELATRLVECTPCCPEQSRMLNALDDVMFLANASIARHGDGK